jgi:protein Mpv17
VATKVLLDELVFGPVHVAGYFGAVTLAEGGSLADARAKIAADFWSAYAAELAFWPAFQSLNFSVVPVRHQLLAVNGACLLDATFLCWVSATDDWVGGVKAAVGWGGEGKKKG